MRYRRSLPCAAAGLLLATTTLALLQGGQGHQPTAPAAPPPNQAAREAKPDPAAVARGKSAFQANCGFCHGNDATGSRAPDLLRSATVTHDENGNLISQILKNGRVSQGMPAFPNLKPDTVADITAFLHNQSYEAAHSANVPSDYPVEKLLTGNAQAGKAYFEGEGGCSGCHSVTGDLAGIAKKYSPVDLQQRMVYPASKDKPTKTAVVITPDGQRHEGIVTHDDEFTVAIRTADGQSESWDKSNVKADVTDKLAAHRALMSRYTDADIHNLFAYLETLK